MAGAGTLMKCKFGKRNRFRIYVYIKRPVILLIQSFVTCIFGIDKVGYVMICFGVGDSLFSYLLGKLTKYVGRIPIFISGAVIHLVVYIVLLTWKPDRDMISVAFLMAALWGYTDAVWQTQINGKEKKMRICLVRKLVRDALHIFS